MALWQKAKAPDLRSALVATLGPAVVVNLLPCHHRHEQPEVSFRGGGGVDDRATEQFYVNPSQSPVRYQWVQPPLRPVCLKDDPLSLNQQKAVYAV